MGFPFAISLSVPAPGDTRPILPIERARPKRNFGKIGTDASTAPMMPRARPSHSCRKLWGKAASAPLE